MNTKRNSKAEYRRDLALARSIGGRIFCLADGRLILVGGLPEFRQLKDCLARRQRVPTIGQSPKANILYFHSLLENQHGH